MKLRTLHTNRVFHPDDELDLYYYDEFQGRVKFQQLVEYHYYEEVVYFDECIISLSYFDHGF